MHGQRTFATVSDTLVTFRKSLISEESSLKKASGQPLLQVFRRPKGIMLQLEILGSERLRVLR